MIHYKDLIDLGFQEDVVQEPHLLNEVGRPQVYLLYTIGPFVHHDNASLYRELVLSWDAEKPNHVKASWLSKEGDILGHLSLHTLSAIKEFLFLFDEIEKEEL